MGWIGSWVHKFTWQRVASGRVDENRPTDTLFFGYFPDRPCLVGAFCVEFIRQCMCVCVCVCVLYSVNEQVGHSQTWCATAGRKNRENCRDFSTIALNARNDPTAVRTDTASLTPKIRQVQHVVTPRQIITGISLIRRPSRFQATD